LSGRRRRGATRGTRDSIRVCLVDQRGRLRRATSWKSGDSLRREADRHDVDRYGRIEEVREAGLRIGGVLFDFESARRIASGGFELQPAKVRVGAVTSCTSETCFFTLGVS